MLLKEAACREESIHSEELDTKSLQSIYFAYEVSIISSYSNTICCSNTNLIQILYNLRLLEQYLRTIV